MGVSIVSEKAFLSAVARARSVELSASQLAMGPGERSRLLDALEQAAEHGAHVVVRLADDPYDPRGTDERGRTNRAAAAVLREHGVDASTVVFPPGAPLHMKAAVLDGRAFLDDRNWPSDGCDTIVELDAPGEVACVRGAMRGDAVDASGELGVRKSRALELEAATIASASPQAVVEVASESFGAGGVASALLARARAGGMVRVVVEARALRGNEREARLLERLAAAGARVRVANRDGDEKLCVAGARGWVGSANATAGWPGTVDWGLRTRDRAVLEGLRAAFAREWSSARPFADTQACWTG